MREADLEVPREGPSAEADGFLGLAAGGGGILALGEGLFECAGWLLDGEGVTAAEGTRGVAGGAQRKDGEEKEEAHGKAAVS